MDDHTHIAIFDQPYSKEKQAKGIAISEACAFGKCNKCVFLKQCESDRTFNFPPSAWCMQRKSEILEKWEG